MKRMIWTVAGVCAAAAGILVWGSTRIPKAAELTGKPEEAWADPHVAA